MTKLKDIFADFTTESGRRGHFFGYNWTVTFLGTSHWRVYFTLDGGNKRKYSAPLQTFETVEQAQKWIEEKANSYRMVEWSKSW